MKVGDKVVVRKHGFGGDVYLAEIERETKLYFIVDDMKFRKSDLHMAGGDIWNYRNIEELTEEWMVTLRRKHLVRKLYSSLNVLNNSYVAEKLTDEEIKSILTLVQKYAPVYNG